MPKYRILAMGSFLRIVILKFYRSISGITGFPVKNFGRSVFSWLLDSEIRLGISCFVKKCHGDKGWGDLKKSTLIKISHLKISQFIFPI
jgi:hypothetical protein